MTFSALGDPMATDLAHTILRAVHLTSNGEIEALRELVASTSLQHELLLRILLTYLPEGSDPTSCISLLQDTTAVHEDYYERSNTTRLAIDDGISDQDARQRVRRLRLAPLECAQYPVDPSADPLTLFLIHQAYVIDADTGSLVLVSRLLEPFVNHSEVLRTWMISNLLPLLRLDYEYYPLSSASLSLAEFTKLDGRVAIQTLLSKASGKIIHGDRAEIGRDLKGLVSPWIYGETSRKRRKLYRDEARAASTAQVGNADAFDSPEEETQMNDWSYVFDSLLELSTRDFPRAVDAIVQWEGTTDVDYGDWGNAGFMEDRQHSSSIMTRYVQVGLAINYSTNNASLETIMGSHRVLLQAVKRAELDEPPDLKRSDALVKSGITQNFLESLSATDLLHNALLLSHNPLTIPSQQSVSLMNIIMASCYKLLNLGSLMSVKAVIGLALFSEESEQMTELRRTLHKLKNEKMDEKVWASIRRQLLWLHNWEDQSDCATQRPRGVFGRISPIICEKEILKAMLDGTCYTLVADLYCKANNPPLPADVVEDSILTSAFSSYDSASNGNRTRGALLKASEITKTYQSYFPHSERFTQIKALLSATHAMSFYTLTLQHGVPFRPVNIRVHKDPMALIGKILDQNPRSYTHLDDLLEIGQNLVIAGLAYQSKDNDMPPRERDMEHETIIARRRIIRMAIEAALAEDDFDTAYSYAINRLSIMSQPKAEEDAVSQVPASYDDISWRAAYAAGRFPERDTGSSALRRLEQRMELLSQALLLAPPSSLSEVLSAWQACETQFTERVAQESAAEERGPSTSSQSVPGDFDDEVSPVQHRARNPLRGSIQEEAPVGLFDVARGAAAALSKSTFPLRGAPKAGTAFQSRSRPVSGASMEGSSDGSVIGNEESGRVRKRDVVSNMVTGGLASGIGWVIGAPPVRQE